MPGLGATSNAVCWLFWSLAAIAVALRCAGSMHRSRSLRLDDFIIAFSLIVNLCGNIFNSIAIHYGLGEYISDLLADPEAIDRAVFNGVIEGVFTMLAFATPKIAVALLVNRILNPRPSLKIFHIALVLVLTVIVVVLLSLSFIQCSPVAHQWNPDQVPGTCWDSNIVKRVGLASGALGAFVDLYFSLYPPIIISRLRMPLRKKIIVSIIMSLGLFALFTTLYSTAAVLSAIGVKRTDATYVFGQLGLWTSLGPSVTMIAGSIPTWGWLLGTQLFKSLIAWTTLQRPGFPDSPVTVDSGGGEDGVKTNTESKQAKRAIGCAKERKPQPAFDSIEELERSARR